MTYPFGGRQTRRPSTLTVQRTALALAALVSCVVARAEMTQPHSGLPTVASNPAAASPSVPLTLAGAVALALERSPELAVTRAEVAAAQGAEEQAGLMPNPELAASIEDTQRRTRTTAVQVSQRLELGGKRQARLMAAHQGRAIAQARLEGLQAKIGAEVSASFWEALAAQARLDQANALSQLARQATDAAAKRVAAGKVSPVDETRARLAASGVDLELAQAQVELQIARTRLAAHWGAIEALLPPLEGVLQVPEDVATVSLEERIETAPEVVEARLEVARRQALVDVERSRAMPDITVGLGVQRNNEIGRNQPLIGVSVPLPMFDRNQGNLKEALAREDQARYALQATVSRLRAGAHIALAQAQSARKQALMIERELLPKAQSAYDAATNGFALGKFTFLDVLDAQRSLFQARGQHLKSVAESQRAAIDLGRILGMARTAPVTTQRTE